MNIMKTARQVGQMMQMVRQGAVNRVAASRVPFGSAMRPNRNVETVKEFQSLMNQILGFTWLVEDGIAGYYTLRALRDFQRGFAVWDLSIDIVLGPNTINAARHSASSQGKCSRWYSFRDFISNGPRVLSRRNRIVCITREAVRMGDAVCDHYGRKVRIYGYRSEDRNAAVGGASMSRHSFGFCEALDYDATLFLSEAVAVAAGARGIGIRRWEGREVVVHADTRPLVARWWYDARGRAVNRKPW